MNECKKKSESCCGRHNLQWLWILVSCVLLSCVLLMLTRSATAQSLSNPFAVSFVVAVGQEAASDDAIRISQPDDSQSESTLTPDEPIEKEIQKEVVAEVGEPEFSKASANATEATVSSGQAQNPHPLSVEPSSQMLPKDRPSWIEADPDMESEVHRFVVASIPTSLQSELDSNLEATLVAALKNYVNQQYGADTDQMLHEQLTAAFIRTNLVDDNKTYVAEMQTGEGPLFQKWVMVEITPEQRNQIRLWISQQLQRQRVVPLGLMIGGLLSLVGMAHLILRRKSSLPDNLKATQVQFKSFPVQLAENKGQCKKSRCRGFGLVTAIAIATLAAWFISVSDNSSGKRKRPMNQRQEVELRFAPAANTVEEQSETCEV